MLFTGQVSKVIQKGLKFFNVPYANSCVDCDKAEFTPVGLKNGVLYYYNTDSNRFETVTPTLSSARVNVGVPTKIVLTYAVPLDETSVPAVGAFTASGGKTVTAVDVLGKTVTVTVNTAYVTGNVITISYTAGSAPIKDTYGNKASNLVTQAVTNNLV